MSSTTDRQTQGNERCFFFLLFFLSFLPRILSFELRRVVSSVVALRSCLQDSDLLAKITEEVNGTLKNKVSSHLFFRFLFSRECFQDERTVVRLCLCVAR